MPRFLNAEIAERYLTKEFLGRGAHAEVYRAHDAVRAGDVALKIFHPDALDAQQAEAASQFEVWDGAAVVPLFDVHPGALEGELTAMPLMAGTLADEAQVFASQAVHYARRIATALDFCHGRGVIHGDVKPTNVFRNAQGAVMLGDFGVRDFMPGGRRGHTLEYAAPELVSGGPRSEATDVWAAAVVLYELLCEAPPFGSRASESDDVIADRVVACRCMPPDKVRPYLPLRVRRFFEKVFVPDPAEREILTAPQLRNQLGDLSIHTEWLRVSREGFATVWEGYAVDSEGERTGVRYEARLRHLVRLGLWETVIARAQPGGSMRRLTGIGPFRGTEARARQRMVKWMRHLTSDGRAA